MGPRPLPAQVDWHDGVRLPLPPRVETEDGLVRPARGSSCRHPTSLSRTGGGCTCPSLRGTVHVHAQRGIRSLGVSGSTRRGDTRVHALAELHSGEVLAPRGWLACRPARQPSLFPALMA